MYVNSWAREEIQTKWVRPQDLHYTWADWLAVVEKSNKRAKEQEKAHKASVKNRRQKIAALPNEVVSLFSPHQIQSLIDRNYTNVNIDIKFLERLVNAAQLSHPAIKSAKIADEVTSALQLLG